MVWKQHTELLHKASRGESVMMPDGVNTTYRALTQGVKRWISHDARWCEYNIQSSYTRHQEVNQSWCQMVWIQHTELLHKASKGESVMMPDGVNTTYRALAQGIKRWISHDARWCEYNFIQSSYARHQKVNQSWCQMVWIQFHTELLHKASKGESVMMPDGVNTTYRALTQGVKRWIGHDARWCEYNIQSSYTRRQKVNQSWCQMVWIQHTELLHKASRGESVMMPDGVNTTYRALTQGVKRWIGHEYNIQSSYTRHQEVNQSWCQMVWIQFHTELLRKASKGESVMMPDGVNTTYRALTQGVKRWISHDARWCEYNIQSSYTRHQEVNQSWCQMVWIQHTELLHKASKGESVMMPDGVNTTYRALTQGVKRWISHDARWCEYNIQSSYTRHQEVNQSWCQMVWIQFHTELLHKASKGESVMMPDGVNTTYRALAQGVKRWISHDARWCEYNIQSSYTRHQEVNQSWCQMVWIQHTELLHKASKGESVMMPDGVNTTYRALAQGIKRWISHDARWCEYNFIQSSYARHQKVNQSWCQMVWIQFRTELLHKVSKGESVIMPDGVNTTYRVLTQGVKRWISHDARWCEYNIQSSYTRHQEVNQSWCQMVWIQHTELLHKASKGESVMMPDGVNTTYRALTQGIKRWISHDARWCEYNIQSSCTRRQKVNRSWCQMVWIQHTELLHKASKGESVMMPDGVNTTYRALTQGVKRWISQAWYQYNDEGRVHTRASLTYVPGQTRVNGLVWTEK